MAIVNFSVPKGLEQRVLETVQRKGFASKAEFFRFAAMYVIDILDRKENNEEERLEHLVEALQDEISKTYRGRKLPSLKEQLADL